MAASFELVDSVDLVLGQRLSTDTGWLLWQHVSRSQAAAVYEADDLLMDLPKHFPNAAFWRSAETQRHVRNAVGQSDAMIVSTQPLAEEFSVLHDRVHVIPNYVNEAFIREAPAVRGGSDPVVIGWGGGMTHRRDLATVERVLSRVLRQLGARAELHLMGIDYRSLFDSRGRFTSWIQDVEEYLPALDFDIGLCPSRTRASTGARPR